jgi:beta-fructofuranosidase
MTETDSETANLNRMKLASDPYRPAYHFLAPHNWLNDPNGTIFWKGRYHLFYQHNPYGAYHGGATGTIHWGHAVSEDLVHWQDLPIALAPVDSSDPDGCYSGTAFVNMDGVPTIIYHGVPGGICIATSRDDLLVEWEKHPANPVIPTPVPGDDYKVDGAPCAWIEGDTYYALTGNSSQEAFDGLEPDRAFLFRSKDLVHWEYLHTLYEGGEHTEIGEDCAVPDFFPMGDRHVLLFASHRRGPQYYTGTYENQRFTPTRYGRQAYGETNFSNRTGILNECQTLLDGNGRRVLFGRLSEGRYGYIQRASGWSGIMALPMTLSMCEQGDLLLNPVEELAALRRNRVQLSDIHLAGDSTITLDGVRGNRLEIRAVFSWEGAEEFGLSVCCSPDGAEQTMIRFNVNPNDSTQPQDKMSPDRMLVLDVTRSSVSQAVKNRESQRCIVRHSYGKPIELRVFVDRSVVEVFAEGGHYLGKRIYPARPDSLGVQIFSLGGNATLHSLEAWEMDAIWPI